MNEIARYLVVVILAMTVILAAANVCRRYGPTASESEAETLLAQFADPDPQVRANAQFKIMARRAQLVPVLAKIVNGDNAIARKEAAMALCTPKVPGRSAALPGLIRMLRGDDLASQRVAIEALGSIGPDAAEAIPDLHKVLRAQQVSQTRLVSPCSYVPAALRQILGRDSVPFLMEALCHPHTRMEVIDSLAELEADAAPALDALERIHMNESGKTREYAERTLKRIREALAAGR